MNIVLTMDVELWSWRGNFEEDIEKPVFRTIELIQNENVPITLFVSLSEKGLVFRDYFKKITDFIASLHKSNLIEFGIHTHCRNLPTAFQTKNDDLKDYSLEQIEEIISTCKKELEKVLGKKIYAHRAGNYSIPPLNIMDEIFKKTGITIDSSDISIYYSTVKRYNNFYEMPPATNEYFSKKLRVFSPDQMGFDEMIKFYKESKGYTRNLIMNSHSFSMYGKTGIHPESSFVQIWYNIPVTLQKMLRPGISISKKISRKFGKKEKINSIPYETLKKAMIYLKEDGCKFTSFNEIIRAYS